ncbi:MAG: hypothetical protein Q8O67_14465 [Deltaproteobacteria bacterium]|nr:hypothetical protein [Deltaproteobacteria bacterium]
MLSPTPRHALLLAFAGLFLLGADCVNFAIPEDARLTCTAKSDCPAEFLCSDELGRCVPENPEDGTAPALDGLALVEPGIAAVGDDVVWAFGVDEALGIPPVVQVGDQLAKLDVVDGLAFRFRYTIADGDGDAITARVRLVDLVGNEATVELPGVAVDRVGPALPAVQTTVFDDEAPLTLKTHATGGDNISVVGQLAEDGVVVVDVELLVGTAVSAAVGDIVADDQPFESLVLSAQLPLGFDEDEKVAFRVTLADRLGNQSISETEPLRADTTPALASITIDGGLLNPLITDAVDVDVVLDSADAVEVCLRGDLEEAGDCDDDDAFLPAQVTRAVTLTATPGRKRIEAVVRDRAFLETVAAAEIVLLDDDVVVSAPVLVLPAGQSAAKPGDTLQVEGSTVAGASIGSVVLLDGNNAEVTPAPAVAVQADGSFVGFFVVGDLANGSTLRLQVITDFEGVLSEAGPSTSAAVVVDAVPATVTVRLANGAASTTNSSALVDIDAADAVLTCISGDVVESSDCALASSFQAAGADPTLTLLPGSGLRTVTVAVLDRALHRSEAADTIVLLLNDDVRSDPVLVLPAALEGQTQAKPGDVVAVSGLTDPGAVVVSATLVDAITGAVVLTVDNVVADAAGDLVGNFAVPDVANGTGLVLVVIVDFDGIRSPAADSRSAAVVVDSVAPDLTVLPPNGTSLATTSLDIALTADADVIDLRIDSDDVDALVTGGALGVFGDFTNSVRVLLTDGDGGKTLSLSVRDDAFNVTTEVLSVNLAGAVPTVLPVIENNARRAVLGVRTNGADRLAVSGQVTSLSTIAVANVVFGGTGTCTVDVKGAISVALSQSGSVLVGDVAVPPIPAGCLNALDLRLDVEVLSQAAVSSGLQSSAALYVDNAAPLLTPSLTTVGLAEPNFTATTAVSIDVAIVDAHATELRVTGDVDPALGLDVFAPALSGPLALTLSRPNDANNLSFTARDEVGNEATVALNNLVHDGVVPNDPIAALLVYVEDDQEIVDATEASSTFTLAGLGSALEANARLFTLQPGDVPSSSSSRATVPRAAANGSFAAIDVTAVERPAPRDLRLVVVDRAGNRSVGNLVITRPVFGITAPTVPVGDAAFTTNVDVGNAVGLAASIGTLAADAINGAGAARTINFDVDAADLLPEGIDSVTIALSGRDPALSAQSVSIDRIAATVDFTPADVDAALIDVVENAPGTADQIVGAAGAVVDLAGGDDLTGLFTPPVLSVLTVAGTRSIALDGGFSALPIGNNTLQDVTVRVVDAAGNAVQVLLPELNDITRPVIGAATLSIAQARRDIPFDVDFSVVDDQGLLAAVPTVTFGNPVRTTTNIGSALLDVATARAYRAQGIADGTEGTNTVTVVAVDDAGNVSLPRTASILFDFTAPSVAFVNPVDRADGRERTTDRNLTVALIDAGSGPATATADINRVDDGVLVVTDSLTLSGGLFGRLFDAAVLPEGEARRFTVRPVDNVGNVGLASIDLRIDTLIPELTLVVTQDGDTDTEPAFTITADNAGEDVDRFECALGVNGSFVPCAQVGNDFVQGSTTAGAGSVHFFFGARRLSVRAVDVAGNVSAVRSADFNITRRLALAGAGNAFCALVPDGQAGGSPLSCWGDNRSAMFDLTAPTDDVGLDAPRQLLPSAVKLLGGSGLPERFTAIGMTEGTMCGARDLSGNFDVLCWGNNVDGQAGVVGPTPPRVVFGNVVGNTAGGPVQKLAVSPQRGCVLREDGGRLFCWGRNALGLVEPAREIASGVRSFDLGDGFLCFAGINGDAFCEGRSDRGQSGQPPDAPPAGSPLRINGSAFDVVEVAAGGQHVCALQGDGHIVCWGDDSFLQARGPAVPPELRFTPTSERFSTQAQGTASLQVAVHLAAAANRTCYVGVDGRFSCHGSGPFGELGDQSFTGRGRDAVTTPLAFDVDDVVAAGNTTCVVPSGDPLQVRCFGDNARGQVGNGAAPVFFSTAPLGSVSNAVGKVSGRSLCFEDAGGLRCSGDGNGLGVFDSLAEDRAEVDDGGALAVALPVLTAVAELTSLTVDPTSGVACVTTSSQVRCRGRTDGPLGRPTFGGPPNDDVFVSGFEEPANLPAGGRSVSGGPGSMCLSSSSDLRCWGDLDPPDSATPAVVGGLIDARDVVVGAAHACVRTNQGIAGLQCFGDNGSGQLGRSGTGGVAAPVVVGGQPFEIDGGGLGGKLAASDDTTCAIKLNTGGASSNVFCWGDNGAGIAGQDPVGGDSDVPSPIEFNGFFQTVALGVGFGCASEPSRLVCWGAVPTGLPFKGPPPPPEQNALLPREVELGLSPNLFSVMAGDGFLCVVRSEVSGPELQCYGDGSGGVFGDGTSMVAVATTVVLP